MYTLVRISDPLNINHVDLDEFPYPLQKFDWDYNFVGDTQSKQQSFGRWDTTNRVEVLNIHSEGEIVENTVANYWTSRLALTDIVVPDPIQTVKKNCKIVIELEGHTGTQYFANCQIVQQSIPVAALGSPTVSPFMMEFTCNKGYWTNVATGQIKKL